MSASGLGNLTSLRQLADAEHRLEQPDEVYHSWEEEGSVLLKQLGIKQSADSFCSALRKFSSEKLALVLGLEHALGERNL